MEVPLVTDKTQWKGRPVYNVYWSVCWNASNVFSLLFFLSERQKSFTFIGIRVQRFKISFDVDDVMTYYVHDVTFFY